LYLAAHFCQSLLTIYIRASFAVAQMNERVVGISTVHGKEEKKKKKKEKKKEKKKPLFNLLD
jgi:hypothetical protein